MGECAGLFGCRLPGRYDCMIGRVAIVGDGAMGTLCALLLGGKGMDVHLWGRDPGRTRLINTDRQNRRYLPGYRLPDCVTASDDPSACFAGCDLVISAIPCQHLRGTWTRLAAYLPPGSPVVSVTKGIEVDTLLRPTQVLREICGPRPYAVLSGPSIAGEVAAGLPATVVLAGDDPALAAAVQAALNTAHFRVYTNDDLIGVELAAAMKNVIALAAGIIDGLRLGDNAKASLITRGLVEIKRLGVALGARPETFSGLAGVGDLITTCISPSGRNRTAGQKIGQGMSASDVVASTPSVIEGIPTTRSVVALARVHGVEMPITEAVFAVLFAGQAPADALHGLMTRELKPE